MAFVQFSKVSLAFGDRDILKDVSVNLAAGTKAALSGANGSGKSTLMKIMAGEIAPDSGQRIAQKDARIVYLPQSGIVHAGCTLRQEADRAFEYGYQLQRELEEIGDALKDSSQKSGPLLERHHEITTQLEESGWYRREAQAEQVLLGLGFSRGDLERQTQEFSGGWQMRIALAKALMQHPDILLLDEPTNYLDLEARNWLEEFLNSFSGGFLLVSHDRYFLDTTVTEVYELFNGDLHRYVGNYTNYEKVRQVELESLMATYQQQQEEIRKLEDFIRRFGAKATKAAQAQERQKMLDKLLTQQVQIPESLKKMRFSFPPAPHSGRLVLTLEGVSKSYDGVRQVLSQLDLVLEKGERLVVVGCNGSGKTTLLKILAQQDASYEGSVKEGAGVAVGYFSQDSAEKICGATTVLEYIENQAPLELIPRVRDMLGSFLFRGDDVFKTLDVLSGGEKSRIALLQLLLSPVNLLVLDEPTNHLDIHSKDVLLTALKDFGGTVIFVSHDRGFIEQLATVVLELKPGEFKYFPGDYVYYLEQTEASGNQQNLNEKATDNSNQNLDKKNGGNVAQKVESKAESKLSWEEQKKRESERRKIEKKVSRLEEEIENLENKKNELETKLSDPQIYSNGEKAKAVQKEIEEIASQIEIVTLEWEKASEELI